MVGGKNGVLGVSAAFLVVGVPSGVCANAQVLSTEVTSVRV